MTPQIGVPGVSDSRVAVLTKEQRISLCADHWTTALPRLGVLEFSRDRKMMSTVNGQPDRPLLLTKGAPEQVLARCSNVLCNDSGDSAPMTKERQQAIRATVCTVIP